MKRYCLNVGTRKLHKTGKCYHSKKSYNMKYFDTEDEVLATEQRYFSHCKFCFKEEK